MVVMRLLAPGHLLAGTLECVAYCSIVGVGGKVRGNGVVGGSVTARLTLRPGCMRSATGSY